MFSADTRGNNEDKREKDPGDILIPTESQENLLKSFLIRVKILTS